jgi:serine/threonine protein kinase
LKNLPQLDVLICHAHGDLHPGNIFVRNNGLDVVLIDFASARYERPTCCDPAMLDVALGIGVVDQLPSLPETRIRRLFEPPLLPPRRFLGGFLRTDNRVRAICQLREHALGEGAADTEYTMAVSIYLMRFASLRPDGENASIAYEMADGLVQALAD